MIKLNINEMELPVFDIIRATPILIPIDKKKHLIFKIPSTEKYFKFQHKHLKVISDYLRLFSNVNFLTVKEFSSLKLKKNMMKELQTAMRNADFITDFNKIIKEYFTGNFNLRNIHKKINPFQYQYLFLFIHNIIENVKSFFFTGGGSAGRPKDVGDFFYFFEKNFHKNRAQILAEPITYAMLLMHKWNQDQADQKRESDKLSKKNKPAKPGLHIKKIRKRKH